MVKRHPEPFLWLLFSAGGVISAMLMPILLLLFGIAYRCAGWPLPTTSRYCACCRNPLTRVVLVALAALSLFHWAHRFRHTLYDGLQIKHLNEVIALVSYGVAVLGSVAAVYVIWRIP